MLSKRRIFPERGWTAPAFLIATVLAVTGLEIPAAAASAKPNPAPHASPGPAVTAVKAVPTRPRHLANPAARNFVPTRTAFPPAHTFTAGAKATTTEPVSVQGAAAARVTVLDQPKAAAAGVAGVLFEVTAAPGKARVGVDYGDWAQAYGGNYANRLQLIAYPSCVLTTPAAPACRRGTPLSTSNSTSLQTLTANVSLTAAPMVLAAATGSSDDGGGKGGTYAAGTLQPEGSWSSGGSTGSFSYSYPITAPASTTGLAPQLDLSYDSATVDGETATTEAQASMAGEGWSIPRSYIEQSFVSCANNPEGTASPTATQDQCYDGPILTMSLNGSTTSLVLDKTSGEWKAQNDSGSVIKHVTGTNNGTATYNTDEWTVTDRDGTVYTFGMNHLPGWASGKTATNSVDYEPVYSAHDPSTAGKGWTDPCFNKTGTGFTKSVCTMAYRWNLDYVKDLHGSAMGFYYTQKTNAYGQDNGAVTGTYVRDSYLAHVDYGFTDGNAYGTVPDQVVFKSANRCVDDATNCASLTSTTKSHWPDVPFDLICSSSCSAHTSPSMFSTERLTSIVTNQYSAADSKFLPVDTYALGQTIPAINGNATTPTLWLSSITHTGNDLAGAPGETGNAAITLPPTTFTPVANALPNRIDTSVLPAFFRNRLASITTESGAQISVSYKLAKPCAVPVKVDPANNTTSCFPVSWTPAGYTAPTLDWFAKYSVDQVTEHSPSGGSPDVTTSYVYDQPAWHFDDNELVKAKYRTYGQFRGFGDVKTFVGDGNTDRRSESETVYYQGMGKDLPDSLGGHHADSDQLAGDPLEATTYQGENGPVDHSTISSYWVSAATATRTRTGLPDLVATTSEPAETLTRQAVTSGGSTTWRYQETDNSYDASTSSTTFGLLLRTYSHTVPAQSPDNACATTTYAAPNIGENLVGLAAETETDSVACGGFTEGTPASVPASLNGLTAPPSVNRPAQVTLDARTFYDDTTFSTAFPQAKAPTKGDVTMNQKAAGYSGGAFQYQTTSRALYDGYGRITRQYDGRDNLAKMDYTTSAIGSTTAEVVTDAMGNATTTTYDPARALTLTTTDPNGVVTTVHSDALGRTSKVWLYSRPVTQPANALYSYAIARDGTAAITTQTLNDESHYVTSTTLDDALLRPRQTQTMTPQGGRMVTDTLYDTRGWVSLKNNGWWDPATTPGTTIVQPRDIGQPVPSQDALTYDGLGRVIADTKEANYNPVPGQVTTTVYNGDRTTVIPPAGGAVQTTITDPLGRTSELDQYRANPSVTAPSDTFTGHYTVTPVAGTVQPTLYGYDSRGHQATVTQGTGGPTWTTSYNLLGQVINKSDPDAGDTDPDHTGNPSIRYDGDGNATQVTDPAGRTVSYTYDALNRKTAEFDADLTHQVAGAAGNQVRSWVYDNSNQAGTMDYAVGKLTAETAYWNHQPYTVQQKNFTIFGGSTGETVTIPSATEGIPLGTSYSFSHSYTATTGLPYQDKYPAAGGLPAETVTHTYATGLDLPDTVGSNLAGYQTGTDYDAWGHVTQSTLGVTPSQAVVTNAYDLTLGRLNETKVTRSTGSATVDDENYAYDPAGDLTKQVSTRLDSAATAETQCFGYDSLDQLTTAWTATDDCKTAPSSTDSSMVGDNLGTASAYWTSWVIDAEGDRSSQTSHAFGAGPATTTTTSYQYDGNNAGQPHTLTGTTATGGGSTSYRYDKTGNMVDRNAAQGDQTLAYDDLGELTQISGGTAGTTSYRYDADGNLLVQQDPSSTVLYLPGEQITLTGTSTTAGVRYIGLPGGATAVRSGTAGNAYSFELADRHGTPSLYLDSTAQNPTWRQFTPYGEARGADAAVPDNRSFLNKTLDPSTGLTDIGARAYDATTGRFTTLDPVLEPNTPGLLNGYSYTANNPIGQSDPTGLRPQDPDLDTQFGEPKPGTGKDQSHYVGSPANTQASVAASCGYYCKLLKKPTPRQATLAQRCGNRGDTPGACHDGASTYADALIIGASSSDNWTWACSYLMELDPTECEHNDPFANKHSLESAALLTSMLFDGLLSPALDLLALPSEMEGADSESQLVSEEVGLEQSLSSKLETLVPEETADSSVLASGLRGFCQGGGNSFAPDTPVLLADGTTEPINDVQVGDQVLSTDPITATTGPETVTQLHDNLDHDLADLSIATAGGQHEVVRTTQQHPFWDVTTRRWTAVADLRIGDQLATTSDAPARVAAIRKFSGSRHMLNLTVATFHTYYVLAGTTPVLVHNTGCWSTTTVKAGDLAGKYKPGQSTRDPASQWYHENLSNDELLDGINNAPEGDGIVVSRNGTILGGHHRWDELQTRIQDGRIDPNTEINVQVYGGE